MESNYFGQANAEVSCGPGAISRLAPEQPVRNAYWDNKEAGLYVDVVSGEPLFTSLDKILKWLRIAKFHGRGKGSEGGGEARREPRGDPDGSAIESGR